MGSVVYVVYVDYVVYVVYLVYVVNVVVVVARGAKKLTRLCGPQHIHNFTKSKEKVKIQKTRFDVLGLLVN